jgi:hypothetical protein
MIILVGLVLLPASLFLLSAARVLGNVGSHLVVVVL